MAKQSIIILAKNIKIDKEYNNVLSYKEQEMLNLVASPEHLVSRKEHYSFIRENTISTDFSYDECIKSNYIAFQNKNYSNKWFFAWITDIKFIGDACTEISYEIDVWSTWYEKWKLSDCFVKREHVNDDAVGVNTLDEGLNIGDLICDNVTNSTIIGSNSSYWFVIASNYDPSDKSRYAGVGSYAGYPQGSMWFAWDVNIDNPSDTINSISDWVYNVTKDGQDGNIQTMFALPSQAFNFDDVDSLTHKVKQGKGNKLDTDITFDKTLMRTFDDFTPKNNKLFTYPFSFVRVTNNLGSVNDYKIEDFNDLNPAGEPTNNLVFNAIGVPCQGYSGKLRPKYYKGQNRNEDESIALGKYPTLSWSCDGFTNWMTQNAVNIAINGINTAVSGATLASKGKYGKASLSAAENTATTLNEMFNASRGSNVALGNANAGDVSFSLNIIRFTFLHMRPKKEYLEIIDDYFSRYGYKIDRIKKPNILGRKNFNYIEIGENEILGYGEIPAFYMDKINNIARTGVTIWHKHENIGNFNIDNSII